MTLKATILGAGLVLGLAAAAQAQSNPNIANLPMEGPRASSHGYQGPQHQVAVMPSPAYIGPGPGGQATSAMQNYQKPAGWDQNLAAHPYSSDITPSLTSEHE